MKSYKKNVILALVTALFALSLSACNTSRGLGKDLERAGEEIQDAAR